MDRRGFLGALAALPIVAKMHRLTDKENEKYYKVQTITRQDDVGFVSGSGVIPHCSGVFVSGSGTYI